MVRIAGDKYYTPTSLVRDFFAVETFASIYDPCAGAGHILDACAEAGIRAQGADIEPDRSDIARADFHTSWRPGDRLEHDVVTNPPFGPQGREAVFFIEASLMLTQTKGRKVAMLLHEDFDSAKTRRHLFADHPAFAGKYVLLQRILWANIEHTARASTNHAWFVWDWSREPGDPFLRYLGSADGKDWR